jgi:Zn-dependent protease
MEPLPDNMRDYEPVHPKGYDWRGLARKIWAPIAALIGVAIKFGALFAKFGLLFVSLGGYALIWGWKFGLGFVFLILVHELGHFVEGRRQGFRPSLPTFIPFLGAYVAFRDERINPWQHALISLAGPFTGGLAAAALWVYGESTGSSLFQALGYTGFFLNLFNLLPIGFLDGGSIARNFRYLRLGGARDRAYVVGVLYAGLALALIAGMYGAYVHQHRL